MSLCRAGHCHQECKICTQLPTAYVWRDLVSEEKNPSFTQSLLHLGFSFQHQVVLVQESSFLEVNTSDKRQRTLLGSFKYHLAAWSSNDQQVNGVILLAGTFILNCNMDQGFYIQNVAKVICLESRRFLGPSLCRPYSVITVNNNYSNHNPPRQNHSGNAKEPSYWLKTREFYDRWQRNQMKIFNYRLGTSLPQ